MTRTRPLFLLLYVLVVAVAGACANADEKRRADALAAADTPLDDGAERQPIPPGIDPAMVTWRSDGVLIPSQDSFVKTPGYVVDSIFPPEEALRRFQAEEGVSVVTALSGGERSTDALLRRYWDILSSGDSLALTPYVVSKSEFAHLYFPESNEPDNGMMPHISWLLLSNNSGRGLTRALAVAANNDSTLRTTVCQPALSYTAGRNTIHGPCGVIRNDPARTDTVWIVKHIIERDGVFKLMSFTNEL